MSALRPAIFEKSARTPVGEPQNLKSGTVQDQPGEGCASGLVAHKRRPRHEVHGADSRERSVSVQDEGRWFLEKREGKVHSFRHLPSLSLILSNDQISLIISEGSKEKMQTKN